MEFHVKADNGEEFIGEGLVFDQECEEDPMLAFWKIIWGCSLVLRSVIQKVTDDPEEQNELIDEATSSLRNHAKATIRSRRRTLEYIETDPPRPRLYRLLHNKCQRWFESKCSYDDLDKLFADIRAYGVRPKLEYDNTADKLCIVLKPDSEHLSCGFSETLRSIGLKEDKEHIENAVRVNEKVATILYDYVYGEDDNPLRADDWIHLDKLLPSFLESI